MPAKLYQPSPRWRRVLGRVGIDLREGEAGPAILLFICFFLFICFQYTAKTVRQSTFIDALGAAKLPYVYLLVAVFSYPLLRIYGSLTDRMARHRLVAATCTIFAVSMVFFWWLFQYDLAWVPVAFYVWVSIVFVMTVSQFWTFANHVLDPRQAKRLFGFVGAGGLAGGVAGGQVARLATHYAGTRYALLVAGGILLLGVVVMWFVERFRPASDDRVAGVYVDDGGVDAAGGLATIRRSRPLRMIATIMLLAVVVAQIVDLQFNWAVEQAIGGLDQRTKFFGNFYSIMGLAAIIFQLVFTARIHRSLGAGFGLRVLPSTLAFGTGALFLSAGFFPMALVFAAMVLKIGENGLRYSLDQATRELLYLPVPSALRIKAKAFIDVFIQRGAKGVAALLLLPVTFGLFTPVQAGLMSLVLIAIWLVVTVGAYREYVSSFRDGLAKRLLDTTVSVNLDDPATLEEVVHSLGSSDYRLVLQGIELLSENDRGRLIPPFLLHHDEASVRLATLKVLSRAGRRDALPLISRCVGDEDPRVRARAIRVLSQLSREDPCDLMLPKLHDTEPGVRAAAISCIVQHGKRDMQDTAAAVLTDMLKDADKLVRTEAAKAIGEIPEPAFQGDLLQLLYDRRVLVARTAITAVRRRVARDGFTPIYGPTLISLLGNRRLKHEVREALVAFGEPVLPALVHFMNDPHEQPWVRRALPKTIAKIGTLAGLEALLDGLREPADGYQRRKLVQALTLLGPLPAAHVASVESAIRDECKSYLRALADIRSLAPIEGARYEAPVVRWQQAGLEPRLLEQLLAERLEAALRNLFGLLSLLHSPLDVWAALRSLLSGKPALKNHALEYLDNVLSGDLRRQVFAVIDDVNIDEKIARGGKISGIGFSTKADTLKRMLREVVDGDEDRATLAVAALYTIYSDSMSELHAEVERLLTTDCEPFVQETAVWVARRIGLAAAADSGDTTEEESSR